MGTSNRDWAEEEFGGAELGDGRRTARLVEMGACAARQPSGTLPQVFPTSASQEAAFRFVRNDQVRPEEVARASHVATVGRCTTPYVWVALDQSSLSLTDRTGQKGFGRVGTQPSDQVRGLESMNALAVSPQGEPLGLVGQSWWRRPDALPPPWPQDRRPVHERESGLWVETMKQSHQRFGEVEGASRPWYQLDRGGDAWHVLHHAVTQDQWVTVRAAHDRRLEEQSAWPYLKPTLQRQKVGGQLSVRLPLHAARRAGHRVDRPRHLTVRFAPVTLRLKTFEQKVLPAEVTAVYVREKRPPAGAERIEWWLLTTAPVHGLADALNVVRGYTQRWRVEEFHRTWKRGGCQVERSQLRSVDAFVRWATVLASVATRIERLKVLSRKQPDLSARTELSREELDAAILLSQTTQYQRGQDMPLQQAVELIARIGGYTGKSSGGPPGSITLGRGLERVQWTALGLQAAKNTCD